jgi:hypothetical protein
VDRDLPSELAEQTATIREFDAYASYERTGKSIALQTIVAQETFASADASYVQSSQASLTTLQRQLATPTPCTQPPAGISPG